MTPWNQLRDAVRMQVEDFYRGIDKFFRVPWPGLVLMLVILAGAAIELYLCLRFGRGEYFLPRYLLMGVMIILARAVRYYLP